MQRWILSAFIAAAIPLSGCSRTNEPPGNSSETHFLRHCDNDGSDCGPGLACMCGVCTVADDCDRCAAWSGAAECSDPSAAACATPICDVTCRNDADCRALSSAHECSSGHCRAPDPDARPALADAGDAAAGPAACHCAEGDTCFEAGESFQSECNGCFCDESGSSCTTKACPSPPCAAGACEFAGFCIEDGRRFLPVMTNHANCGFCTCTAGEVSCENHCEPWPDAPPCEQSACEQHGVCYPLGATTEDGCCTCMEDGFSCIAAGWCTDMAPLIGARCESDGDCSRGLTCRTDLAGERGLCVRDCNHGCPTSTVCAPALQDYKGYFLGDVCMRPCETNADCPLGTTCDTPGTTTTRYCY